MSAKSAIAGALVGAAATAFASWAWSRRSDSKPVEDDDDAESTVLFFPAAGQPPCKFSLLGTPCTRRNCNYNHAPSHPLISLLATLRTATQTMDIAMYTFSFSFLKDAVLSAKRCGARVRVVVDAEQLDAAGCAIGELLHNGIQIRKGPSTFYLHHKFAILDGTVLVNGSLNWSRAACLGNHENVLISRQQQILESFQREFDRLWQLYDPANIKPPV